MFLGFQKSCFLCIDDGLYADDGFNSFEIYYLMSYTKYKIEVANARGDKYYITINELFLLILCFLAEGYDAPRIKKELESIKLVMLQSTIEGYIHQMKHEMFDLVLAGRTDKCTKEELVQEAIKFGFIAKRNDKYEIIIAETIAMKKQLKLF